MVLSRNKQGSVMTTPPAEDPSKPGKLRGLWSVMQSPEVPAEAPPEATSTPAAPVLPTDEPAPRGLWSVMASRPAEAAPDPAEELEPFELVDDTELTAEEDADLEPLEASITIAADVTPVDALGDEFDFTLEEAAPPKSRGWQALLLGLTALPLSATAWFGVLWLSLITAVCGFAALVLAAVEWTATGPVNRRERLKVSVGAFAGALALLIGPYVFSPLGNAYREAKSGRNTQRHLRQIGIAINEYHGGNGSFPIGGTVLRDHEGRARAGHSWMAALLPYLGEQALYGQIDFGEAYDEPVNRPAMSQSIPVYFAAGGSRALNGGGYAVSHFAGVGGDVRSPRGEIQPTGVFHAGKPLTAEDVTDGLASTLLAGELGGHYPAWGDPENFRPPGLGINKGQQGFGNATRSGATMLFADGHVKFFANDTDPEVLRRLSTRNAGDLTAGVE